MIRHIALVISLVATLAIPTTAGAQEQGDVHRFKGGGWGHGVGMSQYGAFAQALEGKSAEQILAHYYQGTTTSNLTSLALRTDALTTVPEPLWVGIDQNQTSLTFEAIGGQLDLCQAGDGTGPCPRTEHPQPGEIWTFEQVDGGCRFFKNGAPTGPQPGQCRASIDWDETTTRVKLNGREYAYGTVKLRTALVSAGAFHVSLALDLEDYMRGIAEMPPHWAQEALQAQAIAARSFATYRFLIYEQPALRTEADAGLSDNRKESCWCHVYDSIKDQVYLGFTTETLTYAANWQSAVAGTAGLVATYNGPDWPSFTRDQVIGSFYFSSTAGMTETNVDGFGSSSQYPYLHSVDDHWSTNAGLNPNAYWEKDVTSAVMAAALGWDAVTFVDLIKAMPGAMVTFTGILNGQAVQETKGPSWLRSKLSLPSPHIIGLEGDPTGPAQGAEDPTSIVHPFTDIDENIHERSIDTIWQAGITTGCSTSEYCPEDPVKRYQIVVFLIRAWPYSGFETPTPRDEGFTDIGGLNQSVQDMINQLATLQITSGTTETTFGPNDEVTRWQMAIFLARLAERAGLSMPDGLDQGFTDLEGISAVATTSINQIKQLGITSGTGNNTYSPNAPVRRDEMATFVARTLELIGNTE